MFRKLPMPGMEKNWEIESLRAYAILITLVAHLGNLFPSWVPGLSFFWLGGGVDLFFCISGFVITSSLIRQHAGREGDFLRLAVPFWTRRIFRLWPAGWFWIAFTLLCAGLFNRSGVFGTVWGNIDTAVAALLQVANLHLVSCASLSASPCQENALWPYWSLSLEEQFYAVFPVLIFFLGWRKLALVAVVLVAAQFFLVRTWPSPLWFLRTDSIFLGVLIGMAAEGSSLRRLDLAFLRPVRVPLVLLLAALLVLVARPSVAWFYWGLTAAVSACLVLLAAFDQGYLLGEGRLRRALSAIGARSYSLYLVHMPAFLLTRELAHRMSPTLLDGKFHGSMLVVALVLLIALTEFSYRIIERPLRRAGRRISAEMTAARPQVIVALRTGS